MSRNHAQAISVLSSWLDFSYIPHSKGQAGYHLAVKRRDDEGFTLVAFYAKEEAPPCLADPYITIRSSDLLSPDPLVSIPTFHRVTEVSGYGTPPVHLRPVTPTGKKTTDSTLALLRWRELHAAPNLSKEVLSQYRESIENAIRWFRRTFPVLCRNMWWMLDPEDVAQVCLSLCVNFHHHSRKPHPDDPSENGKLLTYQLQQRLATWGTDLMRKRHSLTPTLDDFMLAMTGSLNGEREFKEESPEQARIEDLLELKGAERDGLSEEDRELLKWANERKKEANKKKKRARKDLDDYFSALPHDRMLDTLKELSQNLHLPPDARYEARRRLGRHHEGCDDCRFAAAKDVTPKKPEPEQSDLKRAS